MSALALIATLLLAAPIPDLTGPVVDQAGVLSGAERRRLEDLSRAALSASARGVQLQYLLVDSLDGRAIEDFSIAVAERWKLGTKGKDAGLLVVVSVKDHRARIEVGGGLEGDVTDAQAARILRDVMAPAFREGRYGDGLYDAGLQLLAASGALPPDTARRQAARPPQAHRLGGLGYVALVIVLLVLRVAFFGFSGRRRRSLWWGGGGGGVWGGAGGGSGGDGGGWSGGGGGFSGGGASGSW